MFPYSLLLPISHFDVYAIIDRLRFVSMLRVKFGNFYSCHGYQIANSAFHVEF